jgi:hypothetical protein
VYSHRARPAMGPSRDPVADGVHQVFPQWWVACGLCRRGVRGTASLAPCPRPGCRLLWSPWLGGCMWFRHRLIGGAALLRGLARQLGRMSSDRCHCFGGRVGLAVGGQGSAPCPPRAVVCCPQRRPSVPCRVCLILRHHPHTPSPWAHRAGTASPPEGCPSTRRAPLSGAPALPLHTVPPASCLVRCQSCDACCCCGWPCSCSLQLPCVPPSLMSLLTFATAAPRPRRPRPSPPPCTVPRAWSPRPCSPAA